MAAVYGSALRAWLKDESADMGKTMAALDRALGHAESLVRFIGRGAPGRPKNGESDGAVKA
jgi:hypothetical protein